MIPSRAAMPGREKGDSARWVAWSVTWVAYATYYLGRKGLSVAKKPMEADLGIARGDLAVIDTGYLATYALGQVVSGVLGDRIGARRLVGLGMLLSAAMCAWFGASSTAIAFTVAFALNGCAQSTGWPGTVRAMAEWTDSGNRRKVMAVWSTCYQVGGVLASAWAAWLLRYGWRATFFGPAVAIAIVGVLVLATLRPGPGEIPVGATEPESHPGEAREAVRRALASPLLWSFGVSYFAIKLVRYSLLFWLPYYLSDELGYEPRAAGYLSTAFEVGGIVGVLGSGLFTHRFRGISRTGLSAALLALLAVVLLVYARAPHPSTLASAIGLALTGACLFGPDSLLAGPLAQDVGGPRAAATATGLVNGIGSVGAVLQGFLNVWVSRAFGWRAVFYVFVLLSLAASLALVPAARREGSR